MKHSRSGNEVWCCESVARVHDVMEGEREIARRSLEKAYREHSAFVWRNARRLGCDDDTAEDVVHEVFLVVARRFAEFRHQASLRTWLFAITYRTVKRLIRDQKRRGLKLQRYFESLQSRTTADLRDFADASDYLRHLLGQLEEDKRIVFIMMELEDMTSVEVGRCLGVKPATVESRLRLARCALATLIERDKRRERRWCP